MTDNMYIIGIAGGTGSGKTTVVRKIVETLPGDKVALIPQDSYYNDTTSLTMEERRRINFDHPDAFDWDLLTHQIEELRNGRAIEQPTYSYIESNRQAETVHVEPCEVIIIEGIMALYKKELRELMDLKIFVDADADERLIRVIQRDTVERGRTTQMVIDRYLDVLKPMHEEFIEPTKRYADLIVPQGGSNTRAIEIMRTYIIHRLRPGQVS
ncbi:MAG: uridine kinase [Bacteroidaceae bacterium]|nr:uridine kinase [Bacteroidaceae bacterium]MBR1788948.1 uridine kinase [Bacteroidaceae bacterium]